VSPATKFRNPSRIFMSQCELGRRAPAPVLEDRILLVAGGGHRAFCFLIWADVMRTPDQKALYQIMLLREDCINCSAEAESRHTRSQDVRESVALSQQLCNRSESDRDAPKQMEGSRNNATLENNRF
jgi:hypothetical protein